MIFHLFTSPLGHLDPELAPSKGWGEIEFLKCRQYSNFNVLAFPLEKIIVGPQELQDQFFLLQLAMTHYILGSIWLVSLGPI